MKDEDRTREQLLNELVEVRQRLVEHERYATLFEDSRDGIYIRSREGQIIDVNPAALELFGYSKEEMVGLNVQNIYVDSDDRMRFEREIEQKGSVRDYELRLCKGDGTAMDCLVTSTIWRATDGKILGYRGIIHDITERKQMGQALLNAERTRVLAETAGAAAHEINQPLTVIVGLTELLEETISPDNPHRGKIDGLHTAAQRIADIVLKMNTVRQYAAKPYVQGANIVDFDAVSQEYKR